MRGDSFITFDSVRPRHDHSSSLTVTVTAQGPKLFAVSPMFTTGTNAGPDAIGLGSIDEAAGLHVGSQCVLLAAHFIR